MFPKVFFVYIMILPTVSWTLVLEYPYVKTKFGYIQGTYATVSNNQNISMFLCIPYAAPPLKELRFKDPIPWNESYSNGYLKATRKVKCVQPLVKNPEIIIGEENCLCLNVYTPTLNEMANYDVLLFIHGGEFSWGNSYSHDPKYLLTFNKELVFVSINYRLGPFGFLSTEDDIFPGNMGLKDQVLALEWVKNNIKTFGGNPEKVTIAGMSAGAISVHLHYLSPLSRYLFVKGISMSGGALSSLIKSKNIRKNAEYFTSLLNCKKPNTVDKVECLREIDYKEIMNVLVSIAQNGHWSNYSTQIYFGPVIERGGSRPFLNEHPYYILMKGGIKHAPWLASVTTAEGLYTAATFIENESRLVELNDHWNTLAPLLFLFSESAPVNELPKVSQLIRDHYLRDEKISKQNRDQLVKIISDRFYTTNIETAIRLQSEVSNAPIYFYIFDYHGAMSWSRITYGARHTLGVCHGDDLFYIFKMSNHNVSAQDFDMIVRLTTIWNSFIKTGVPDPKTGINWPPIPQKVGQNGYINYMVIQDHNNLKLNYSLDISDRYFWESLPLDELQVSNGRAPNSIQRTEKSWVTRLISLIGLIKSFSVWFSYVFFSKNQL